MPLVLPLMIPGLSPEPWPLLRPLLFTMLIPLAAGCWSRVDPKRGRHGCGRRSERFRTSVLILTVVLLIGLNFTAMLGTFGSGAAAVGVVFVSLSLAVGYALGGPAPTTRSVLGLGTGQRNIAAALLIATQNFPDEPGVVVMLLVDDPRRADSAARRRAVVRPPLEFRRPRKPSVWTSVPAGVDLEGLKP